MKKSDQRKVKVENDILEQTSNLKKRLAERSKRRREKKNQEYEADNGIKLLNLDQISETVTSPNVSLNLELAY